MRRLGFLSRSFPSRTRSAPCAPLRSTHSAPVDPDPVRPPHRERRFLIRDVSLVLHPSELLLVVGRPGAGCTTLLKALAGLTQGFAGVDGEVLYGAMHAGGKGTRAYDGAVCFNSEEDVHVRLLSRATRARFPVGRTTDT